MEEGKKIPENADGPFEENGSQNSKRPLLLLSQSARIFKKYFGNILY